jgi:hypothetical protein
MIVISFIKAWPDFIPFLTFDLFPLVKVMSGNKKKDKLEPHGKIQISKFGFGHEYRFILWFPRISAFSLHLHLVYIVIALLMATLSPGAGNCF